MGKRHGPFFRNVRMKISTSDEDRISGLPKSILDHILSFLDMKQVVQTSVLSKKWKSVWTSVPNLNFCDFKWHKKNCRFDIKTNKFKYFVDTVLLLRDGSDIQKFSLYFKSSSTKDFNRIERWIGYALRRHVQTLELKYVCLSNNAVNGDLIMNLPSVENLIVRNCRHENVKCLIISAPQLKYLMVDNSFEAFKACADIKLCTPKLIELKQLGYVYDTYCLENLSALVKAKIDTRVGNDKVEFSSRLKKILEGIYNAESLSLSAHGFQAFAESPEKLEWFPIICENLKYLRLIRLCNDGYIHSIAKLLDCFPHIETLALDISWRTETFNSKSEEEDWRLQLSFDCTLRYLKSIVIKNCEGCQNELIFLEFLLKHSVGLENIVIESSSKPKAGEKDLVTFSNQIQSLPKASASVSVSLLH